MKNWIAAAGLATATLAGAQWQETLDAAKGQTVYFNAWGGSPLINEYIDWVGEQVEAQYDIELVHVKVGDIADSISRLLSEKATGAQGSIDLMWINGENFANAKANDLLHGPWAEEVPHYSLLDLQNKATLTIDFSVPTDGYELPWGMAQLVFQYDSEFVSEPPTSMAQLLAFAEANPGRVSYPQPPNFYGTTFLKQVAYETLADTSVLQQPASQVDTEQVLAPVWQYLDALHPHLWRGGEAFPANAPQMKQMLNDGELLLSLSFNPNDAQTAVNNGELPESVRSYIHQGGTIGNTHFVAIPFNAQSEAGAQVVANFLISPQAQARKADTQYWGDPTVLNVADLDAATKQAFNNIEVGPAALTSEELSATLLEPHASWVEVLESQWAERYLVR
ncbi:ABC transporter substrate-binding protein [Salinibius halmophilus]|uniref:ABC transporter substrate-binding protein n=1 Tax=Salinibius halmophilus TaxID=1853216 RepID=UPI000E66EDCF|nr:ABC transporter substrate-binding protein [Salinibius halmophilus]